MIIELNISDVILQHELNAAQITITPTFSSGVPDVNKQYVDEGLALKVDKVEGKSLVDDSEISKLSDYPTLLGDPNKFVSDDGSVKSISSIGVTGSQLYASTADSDVAGYKSLVETPQTLETEILLTAKSSDGIVWGAKYLSAPFTEAVTISSTAYGFDYWRKVSAANGTSRKHLRVFLYRAGEETNISTPLASPSIEETEFTERQISYIFPELALLAGDRIGIQEGFSTTHANNITFTYIVGDGRGWFMRLPLPLKHENLTDKNSEPAFQHVDTTITKPFLDAADMVAIKDSVTGNVVLTAINAISVFFSSLFLKFGGQAFGAKKTIGSTDNQDLGLLTNGVERITVIKTGNVGIGANPLNAKLDISGNVNVGTFSGGGTLFFGNDALGNATNKISYASSELGVYTVQALGVNIYTNGFRRMRINSSGDVGINTATPRSKLDIAGSVQIADDTAAASADKDGAIRYRKNANNSYIEMCMQTGASTYAWVIIKQNTW